MTSSLTKIFLSTSLKSDKLYSKDGLTFEKTHDFVGGSSPWAGGGYRPGSFSDKCEGKMLKWGLHIGGAKPRSGNTKPLHLERFDLSEVLNKQE